VVSAPKNPAGFLLFCGPVILLWFYSVFVALAKATAMMNETRRHL